MPVVYKANKRLAITHLLTRTSIIKPEGVIRQQRLEVQEYILHLI